MFKRGKDTNKPTSSLPATSTVPPQPQFPTEDDRIVAEAIVFLVDGGQDEAADVLLSSRASFQPYYVDAWPAGTLFRSPGTGTRIPTVRVSLAASRRAFDTMNNENSSERSAVAQAIEAVWTAAKRDHFLSAIFIDREGRLIPHVVFDIVYGRTDPTHQARMTQLVKSMTANYRKVDGIQVVQQGEPITLRPIPVFPNGPFERDDKLTFVLMPFAAQFHSIYADGIKPGVNSAGLRCQRGDDIMQPGDILGQIWGGLMAAQFIVADVTGANGNVLYELGLAHVVGHQAILLTQNMNDVPFDLRQQRHIVYTASSDGLQKLQTDLRSALQQLVAANATA